MEETMDMDDLSRGEAPSEHRDGTNRSAFGTTGGGDKTGPDPREHEAADAPRAPDALVAAILATDPRGNQAADSEDACTVREKLEADVDNIGLSVDDIRAFWREEWGLGPELIDQIGAWVTSVRSSAPAAPPDATPVGASAAEVEDPDRVKAFDAVVDVMLMYTIEAIRAKGPDAIAADHPNWEQELREKHGPTVRADLMAYARGDESIDFIRAELTELKLPSELVDTVCYWVEAERAAGPAATTATVDEKPATGDESSPPASDAAENKGEKVDESTAAPVSSTATSSPQTSPSGEGGDVWVQPERIEWSAEEVIQ